jgi:adenine phosphoribosyltransferase
VREAAWELARPFGHAGVTKVLALEARGFVLGTAVSLELGAGLVLVRKEGSIHPGPKATVVAAPDWRGREQMLRVQRHVLGPGDRALVVDDWAETGSAARASRTLVAECGAAYVGLSLLVDQLEDDVRAEVAPVASVVDAAELRELLEKG